MINDHYDPFLDDTMVAPNRLFPHNPYNPYVDDGWVSDDEGHPELGRISPCTFARWSTGCAPGTPMNLQKPIIPCRTSSLRHGEPKRHSNTKIPPTALDETPPCPPSQAIAGFGAMEAIKEIKALKQSLMTLANEKQDLWDEIDELRTERAELEAKIELEAMMWWNN